MWLRSPMFVSRAAEDDPRSVRTDIEKHSMKHAAARYTGPNGALPISRQSRAPALRFKSIRQKSAGCGDEGLSAMHLCCPVFLISEVGGQSPDGSVGPARLWYFVASIDLRDRCGQADWSVWQRRHHTEVRRAEQFAHHHNSFSFSSTLVSLRRSRHQILPVTWRCALGDRIPIHGDPRAAPVFRQSIVAVRLSHRRTPLSE